MQGQDHTTRREGDYVAPVLEPAQSRFGAHERGLSGRSNIVCANCSIGD